MDCDAIKTHIESYLDAELTLSDRRDFEQHVAACEACSHALEGMRAIKHMVKDAEYKNAPPSLRHNIQSQLRDYTGEEISRSGLLHWLVFGMGAMSIGSLATWLVMFFMISSPLQSKLADDIISSHVRSLMVDHVTDVKTSDSHTVKPWFNGRVDFSPSIKDVTGAGFELIGGRLDYIQGKAVSAVVYKRRAHIINAFSFKNEASETSETTRVLNRDGYNIIYWKNNGLDHWVISDLNMKELKKFTHLTYQF